MDQNNNSQFNEAKPLSLAESLNKRFGNNNNKNFPVSNQPNNNSRGLFSNPPLPLTQSFGDSLQSHLKSIKNPSLSGMPSFNAQNTSLSDALKRSRQMKVNQPNNITPLNTNSLFISL